MSALLMLIFLEIVYYHLPLAKKKISHCLLYSTEINCKFGFHFFTNY